ncbi:polyhydroxyalkanoate depolymerase [Luteimonas vadosa]|uniref:Polyhydroxyalkanoate depolymerase n=1 Tax=Luteimonas vadosa TaxID=1165507 RepID=A0ABP9E4Q2_9GAMM
MLRRSNHGTTLTMLLYQMHEYSRALMAPYTYWAEANARIFSAPDSWLSGLPGAARIAAGNELLHRIGKDYEKPAFDIHAVEVAGRDVPVVEKTVLEKPFCRLLRFKRYTDDVAGITDMKNDPTVLLVAPLSGHHATLLRDTVRTMLPGHKVYVTDWIDARMVDKSHGTFSLDDYVGYIEEFIRTIGTDNLHVVSVCQPTVPVLAAVSLMAARGEPTPRSLVMMGGPIDPRESPTAVNNLATQKPLWWFESNVIHTVPANYPGRGRRVYPGFLQHAGFMAMNPERHFASHWDFYQDLVKGDLDDAESHRKFYDEYNAVLDMPATYYLDTIRVVFQEFLLPRGLWDVAGERVDPSAIRDVGLLTIEGELDDISGEGQTRAAHKLCTGVAAADRAHYTVPGAGHYGIFSGRRWRTQVYPQVRDFIARFAAAPAKPAKRKAATAAKPLPGRRAGPAPRAAAKPRKAAAKRPARSSAKKKARR